MPALTTLFPVTLHTQWHSPENGQFGASIGRWLLDPDSLTARLKSLCVEFQVKVLGQNVEPCSEDDACEIIKKGSQVLVREVVLYCDGVPQVFARSLLPLTSLTGEEQALANLGEQPLGQVIFSKPNLTRTAIEVGKFDASSSVAHLARQLGQENILPMWGRRSLFHVDSKPLVVAEVFLPNALAYSDKVKAS